MFNSIVLDKLKLSDFMQLIVAGSVTWDTS